MYIISHLWSENKIYDVDTSERQTNENKTDKTGPGFKPMMRHAALCNNAEFKSDVENLSKPVIQREYNGDKNDAALLKCAQLNFCDVNEYRAANKKVFEVPYNPTNKFQISIHETNDGDDRYLMLIRGAPERILENSSHILIDGADAELNEFWKNQFYNAYMKLGGLGERSLGFAEIRFDAAEYPRGFVFKSDPLNFPVTNLRFLGLISMIHPPRAAVIDIVAKCRSDGIKVIMITDDHPLTAKQIARGVGILGENSETVEDIAARLDIPVSEVNLRDARVSVIHGNDFESMTPPTIDEIFDNFPEIIIGRLTAQQQLLLVENCKRKGIIVAVYQENIHIPYLIKVNGGNIAPNWLIVEISDNVSIHVPEDFKINEN